MDNLKKLKKSNEVYLVATYKFGVGCFRIVYQYRKKEAKLQ